MFMVMSKRFEYDAAPTCASTPPWTWAWGAGMSGNQNNLITNPNNAEISISFGAWTGSAGFSWVTSFPVVIAAFGTAWITANYTGDDADRDGESVGTYAITGGDSGALDAIGDKNGPA